MCGKEEKKGRVKGEKREEKEEKVGDQIAKKEVHTHLLPLRGRHFWINQKYSI